MDIKTKFKQLITVLLNNIRERKKMILALSCLVVFFTTYLLILPAFTLDKEEASEQGGIDVPGVEQSADADEIAEEPAVSEPAKTVPKEVAKTDVKKKSADVTLKNDESDDFSVAVESKDAVLSEDMSVTVREIDHSDKKQKKEYDSLYNDALEAVQKAEKKEGLEKPSDFAFAKFYDISLMDGDDEVEPESAVDVKISFSKDLQKELKVADPNRLHIVHFAVDKESGEVTPEVLDADTTDIKVRDNKVTEAAFTADSFSVFAVVYTTLEKTYISASGDTYDIKVTYDETAEIPDNAELVVREIAADSKEYKDNVSAANKETASQNMGEFVDPVQFDISIVADGKEIEPKEGSIVKVEIRLAKSQIENTVTENESKKENSEKPGYILFNGEEIISDISTADGEVTGCIVAHITDAGTAEILDEAESTFDEKNFYIQFETKSFSDYQIQGVNNNGGLNGLPNTIYVGDEIYMQNCGNMWVTNIYPTNSNGIVTETKHNDQDGYKVVRAIKPGTFRICQSSDWHNGDTGNMNQYPGKYITILPARSGTTPPATIQTVSNSSIGVTLNLFDYDLDDYLDDRFNNYDYGDNNPATSAFLNHGINNGHSLKFWGSGNGNNPNGAQNQYHANGVTSIVKDRLNTGAAGGYPVLKSDNTTLAYLFDPSANTSDRTVYANADGLFKKEGDYYVYDSNTNYAWYNPETNSFDVYSDTYLQHSGSENGGYHNPPKKIGFFPFHKYDRDYDLYVNWNKNLNHHFGLSMSVDFSLPKDPKAVVDTENKPIVFEFSGDDDLWVFIDGKLAMDIGGIHQPTSGKINFQNGTVEVNGTLQMGNDEFTNLFSNLYDGKKHTLQVFYIERGGCDSNCMIKFNLTQYGDIHFDKADEDNPSDKLEGAVFGIYKDFACTIPLMENLKGGTSRAYVEESDAQGHVQFSDIPLGTYYLKELHAPEGYPLDNTVHTVEVFVDQETQEIKVVVEIDGVNVEDGVTIHNKKPDPIDLGLEKVWQNAGGQPVDAPDGINATFEIKRIRTYEKYWEETIEGEGRDTFHVTIGWIHNGQTHVYKEYELIAGSPANISWEYVNGYEGSKDCIVNGERIDKDYVSGNVISQALPNLAAGGSTTFYIIDDSENGEAIQRINVSGDQFYGNSGGGVIHHFETITEPDSDFSYSGDDVTNNQVTLPIGTDTWQYTFANLPTFGKGSVAGVDHVVYFNYSYYLEELGNTAPEGTTVIYKDLQGRVINSASDAETSTSGIQEIINRIPTGYLQVEKKVTYNNHAPEDSQQASKLAGTYTFTLYTDEECNTPYKKNGQPVTIPITIEDDGAAVRSDPIELPVGNYWLKETDSTNQDMYPVGDNKLAVTITADDTSSDPVIKSLTNNYDENDGPDKIVLDIEKKFSGLISTDHIPQGFKVYLKYKLNNQDVVLELTKDQLDTQHDNHIKWSSEEDFVWHWRISNIDPEATDFMIKETNYDNAEGYSFDWAKLDTVDITNYPPSNYHDMNVVAPTATLEEVTEDRVEPDNDKNYKVLENDVILISLTGNHGEHGTLVVSQESLNKLERDSIEKKVPSLQGSWKNPCYFFSIQEHPEGFYYKGNTVTFTWDATRECYIVHVEHPQSSMEEVFKVSYDGHTDLNNAMYENHYEEVPVSVDIVKVDQNNRTIKLGGAYFTLRQIEDAAPTPQGTYNSLDGGINEDIGPTDDTTGIVTKEGLTHGYYELTEKSAPDGYIMEDDLKVYFKVDAGKITWLEPGSGAPSTWEKKTTTDETVTFHAATATSKASFEVGNTPGAELPHTGGIGTAVFYILGSILIAASGMMLRRRRKTI